MRRLFLTAWLVLFPGVLSGQALVPGQVYRSPDGYVEILAGNLPLILTVPHDGTLYPADMALRTKALCADPSFRVGSDGATAELSRAIAARVYAVTGKHPWMISNRIHRSRMDGNRSKAQSACGDPETGAAWEQWHRYIGIARNAVVGRGFQIDIHGQSHNIQRVELGYNIGRTRLLDPTQGPVSSLRVFARTWPGAWLSLLRELGSRLETAGFPAIPSDRTWAPGDGEPYYDGGYLTQRYGCPLDTDRICGVQMEHNTEVRRGYRRGAYSAALVSALVPYLSNLGIVW